MDEYQPSSEADAPAQELDAEVGEELAVLAGVRAIEPVRVGPPPLMTAAAAAATGFVAGAATVAVLGRRRTLKDGSGAGRALGLHRRWPRQLATAEPAATQTFLVQVRTLGRRR
ncbi:MAG: hypothetical protein ABSG64_03650 [Solirubrobacteraceae bacterium]|jgi:hypothetical protein